ncbi:MAG: hypothetical protein EPO45_19355 [Sphingobium sp.]|nr:MAG: hypothetical protein EPO45_19355 [Sphingobium sp.]
MRVRRAPAAMRASCSSKVGRRCDGGLGSAGGAASGADGGGGSGAGGAGGVAGLGGAVLLGSTKVAKGRSVGPRARGHGLPSRVSCSFVLSMRRRAIEWRMPSCVAAE